MKLHMLDRGGLLKMLSFSVAMGKGETHSAQNSVSTTRSLLELRRKSTLVSSWRRNPTLM